MGEVTVLGVRHHGPGSARAVAAALEEVRPDAVLIEGAPELDVVAALAADPGMRPPVAGLVYAPEQPRQAAFYPLAVFSPEWVALRWALQHEVTVHFADLPAANQLALRPGDDDAGKADGEEAEGEDAEGQDGGDADAEAGEPAEDPITTLAHAAGFDDPERWWEDAVEHRHRGLDAFRAVTEAMAELRQDSSAGGGRQRSNERREAAMRKALRAAAKTHERVVFVCGAWHAPALEPDAWPTIRHDDEQLRGLPKLKVAATWVPWSNARLSYRSGYGAGVASPGWYEHLFTVPGDVSTRWLTRTARLLREEDIPASAASVIEAVRLADALAALRGRPLAGLSELSDATETVLCSGSRVPLRVVAERLFVGDALGRVPDTTPMVPLARDLERQQKRLRMKVSAAEQTATLDLRTESHRERSHLLHRLDLLGVRWGTPAESGRTRGTFKEAWQLEWRPELSLALIDASGLGTTVAAAAEATVAQKVEDADIAKLTSLVERALLADLPAGLSLCMDALADRAARQHDTQRLMAAVEPLARVTRYGNVRRVDTELVADVLHGMVLRVAIGLGAACSSLDDDAAAAMRGLIDGVQRGIALVDDGELRDRWYAALAGVADQVGVHGAVGGRVTRLLLDGGRIDHDDAGRRLSRQLSRGADAVDGASWLDGFLSGDAALLLHDDTLLPVVDDWLGEVSSELFDDLLPLLRRTFGAFSKPERRMVGEKIRRRDDVAAGTHSRTAELLDEARARRVIPVLRQILGEPR